MLLERDTIRLGSGGREKYNIECLRLGKMQEMRVNLGTLGRVIAVKTGTIYIRLQGAFLVPVA